VGTLLGSLEEELAACSDITFGVYGSANTVTIKPLYASCIEVPMDAAEDSAGLVYGHRTAVEVTVHRQPYLYAASQSILTNLLGTASPAGCAWPTTYTSSTYDPDGAVLAIRVDDTDDLDYSYLFPKLDVRGLVAGYAVNNNRIGASGYMTQAQMEKIESRGNEIMCHSRTHGSDPESWDEFEDETVGAKEDLEALGFTVVNFAQPGTWVGSYNIDETTPWTYGSAADLLLRENFSAYEGYLGSATLTLPVTGNYRYGGSHTGLTAAAPYTAAAAIEDIDAWIAAKVGIEILWHTRYFDTASGLSSADLATVLDYIVTKIAAGTLTVLTPTQLRYAVSA
jgi:hypothetical protein